MGGEKFGLCSYWPFSLGSPPRGRGKALTRPRRPRLAGITPAWAGKSFGVVLDAARRGDHPRVGGEKVMDDAYVDFYYGSPPRGRGKAYEQLQSGITPAQAGKRRQSSHCLRPDRDHPRVGGEKFV